MSEERSQGRIISIDEGLVKSQLGSVVRETVEQTLNKMLGAEADAQETKRNTPRYKGSEMRCNLWSWTE